MTWCLYRKFQEVYKNILLVLGLIREANKAEGPTSPNSAFKNSCGVYMNMNT